MPQAFKNNDAELADHLLIQDREAEPRFTGPTTGRGGYEGPPGRGGGFAGGYGGAPPAGGGGRQIFVNNVCILVAPCSVA